jgi:serine/threonine protein kinase
MEHVLTRAVGLDSAVPADCDEHPMEAHDRYLLCTDGLHGALSFEAIGEALRRRQHPQACADALADAALQQDGSDNITVAVVDVIALPPPGTDGLYESLGELPVLEMPEMGQTIDDYTLDRLLSKGRYSRLFVATDRRTESCVVLKFPHPQVVSEREYLEAFAREAWIGLRIKSPWLAEIIEQAPGRQTRLYSVMPHYRGETLEARLLSHPPVSFEHGLDIALKLCRAVHALHRRGVIHRDIKPENVLLLEDGGLRLLDLGVASLPERGDLPEASMPGTASYLAPELFRDERATAVTDGFAVGVTLYRLFTGGHYPYGEIEPFTHPRFVSFRPLDKHRPDLPAWLGAVIQRAVAPDPKERYADTIELAFDLEHGLAKGGQRAPAPRQPWFRRHPARAWQIAAIVQFLFLLFWFGFRSLHG